MIRTLKTKRLLLTALLLALCVPFLALTYMFKNIQSREGLSNSQVNAITKDSRGYMWFGTASGLNRYDGYDIKTFQTGNGSLPDSYIESVQEDADGYLWVKTASCYVVYDPRFETFNNDVRQRFSKLDIPGSPSLIYIDSHKNFWAFEKKHGCYVIKGGTDLKYEFLFSGSRETSIPEGEVTGIAETPYGAVLVYANGTLVGIDMTRQRVVWQSTHLAQSGVRTRSLHAFCDASSNIWVYGNNTAMIYNRGKNQWISLAELASSWGTSAPSMQDETVKKIVQDKSGRIWVATGRSGIYVVDASRHTVESVRASDNDRSLQSNSIETLFADNTGLVWVGTTRTGVSYFGNDIYRFGMEHLGDITAIAEDRQGGVWFATSEKGLIYRKDGIDHPLTRENSNLTSDIISSLSLAPDGSLWIGSSRGGLDCLNMGKVVHYGKLAGSNSIGSDNVTSIAVDKNANVWVATHGAGLQCISASSGNVISYTVQSRGIASDNVSSVTLGAGNRIVAGTSDGVTVINLNTHEIKNYRGNADGTSPFTNTNVNQAIIDSRGYLWVASHDGLNVLDLDNDHLYALNTSNGLANTMVRAICEDKNHDVWVTTSSGVSRIKVKKGDEVTFSVSNYDVSDGLQVGDFNMQSILCTRSGRVIFGGNSGLNSVNPMEKTSVQSDISKSRVFFTRLFIYDNEVLTGRYYSGNAILPQAISETEKFTLKNSQNTFTIKFAVSDYSGNEKPQYIYWLEGDDDEWHPANSALHGVTFGHLSAGKYTLHVKAVDANGKTTPESTITIVVLRPYWLSWWAICFYLFVIIAPIVWWYKIRPRTNRTELVRLREINEANMKQEVLEEVSEELREPVTNMIPSLTNMINEETDESKKEELSQVHYEAMKMLSMLNSLKETFEEKGDKVSFDDVDRLQKKIRIEHLGERLDDNDYEDDVVAPEENADAVDASKNTIYIVDDNEDFIRYMQDQLSMHYVVEGSSDVEEAIELIIARCPDVVLYKSAMPRVSGSDFCARMKQTEKTAAIKIIEMTENQATIELASNDKNAIANDYIAKPFSIKVIIDRINRQLGIESKALVRRRGRHARGSHAVLDEELFLNAEQFILENLTKTDLSVEMLSDAMKMSRAHLYKRLLAITGKTPVEFIRFIRVRQAAQLLRESDMNVSEVAYAVGFNNPKYFSNYFKEEYGLLPSIYQSRYGK